MYNKAMQIGYKKGFTLIELVGVIAIIAILASLAWAMIGRARTHAQNTRVENDINETGKAIEQFVTLNEVVLAATQSSPGAGMAALPPGNKTVLGFAKAYAAAGPPHGDVYSATACNAFNLLFNTVSAAHYYTILPIPPTSYYVYSYRTSDVKALNSPCPGANDYHQNSARADFTLLTNLDTSDGVSSAYYWVNDRTVGFGSATSIPAP